MAQFTKKKVFSYIAQALFMVLIVWGVYQWQARDLLNEGSQAPDFTLLSLNGEKVTLSELKGSRVVLYFFSPYCAICTFTSKNIMALRQSQDKDVKIIAVALSWESHKELKDYAIKHNFTIPVLPASGDVARLYHIKAFPTIYIIDKKGSIEERVTGYTTELGLRFRLL